MTPRQMLSLSVIVGAALAVVASQASAALYVDLRFENGSKQMNPAPYSTATVQVWAQVTGNDYDPWNDGLCYLYGAVSSTQVNGGCLAGGFGVGVTGVVLNSAFSAGSSQLGVAANLTTDGIQDWGSTSTHGNAIKPCYDGGGLPALFGLGGVTAKPILDGMEFLVATLTVQIYDLNAVPNAETHLTWRKPVWVGPAVSWQSSYPDMISDTAGASYAATNGSVVFAVPEPATFGLLVLGGLAMLRARRR